MASLDSPLTPRLRVIPRLQNLAKPLVGSGELLPSAGWTAALTGQATAGIPAAEGEP